MSSKVRERHNPKIERIRNILTRNKVCAARSIDRMEVKTGGYPLVQELKQCVLYDIADKMFEGADDEMSGTAKLTEKEYILGYSGVWLNNEDYQGILRLLEKIEESSPPNGDDLLEA